MSGCACRPSLPLTPPRPLLLLLLTAVSAHSRLPTIALELLQSRDVALPAGAYHFDNIATGARLYPSDVRYLTLNDTSSCQCRHRCMADIRCMGFEHEADSGTCGLTDTLLPGDVTEKTVGGWSTGRRRGISWLGQPCYADSDCTLLVSGAECSQQQVCSCRRGWSAVSELLCRPDGRWLPITDRSLADAVLVASATDTSLQVCQDACHRAADCWALDYAESTAGCRHYAAAVLTTAEDPKGVVSYVWQFGQADGALPEGYTEVSGRLFRLTRPVAGTEAAAACLQLGGVRYVPDSQDLVETVFEVLGDSIGNRLGVGVNDVLEDGRFDMADGSPLQQGLWNEGEPNNNGGDEDCGGYKYRTRLLDLPCNLNDVQLCEYIGPNLLHADPGQPHQSRDDQLTWWTYDLGAALQVCRVLYLARGDTEELELTEIRVGRHPTDTSDQQSALCVRQTGTFVAAGFGRRFTCPAPLSGRYLHVGQRPGPNKLWDDIAVFGN